MNKCVHHTQDSPAKAKENVPVFVQRIVSETKKNKQAHNQTITLFYQKRETKQTRHSLQRQTNMFLSLDTLENGPQIRKR